MTNRAAFALALLSATALAPSATAQTAQQAAPPPPPAAEQVVVLGSRVKSHTVVNSPVPVDVYTGPELRQALTTGQVGQALTSGVNFDGQWPATPYWHQPGSASAQVVPFPARGSQR